MAHSAPTQRKISLCPCVAPTTRVFLIVYYTARIGPACGGAGAMLGRRALVGRRVRPPAAPTHDMVTCRLDEPTWRERANRHDAGHVARAVGAVATRLFCGKRPWRIHQMRPLCLLESAFWSQTDPNGRVDRVGRSERDVGKWRDCEQAGCTRQRGGSTHHRSAYAWTRPNPPRASYITTGRDPPQNLKSARKRNPTCFDPSGHVKAARSALGAVEAAESRKWVL